MQTSPYLVKEEVVVNRTFSYNPEYGDSRVCVCGHSYYRHFDSWEDMYPCGCKYCGCGEFIEMIGPDKPVEDRWVARANELIQVFDEPEEFMEVME